MRPQKVDDRHVMASLMTVLRSKGYDGASLNELSEATGLKKASLYHRFPGGKEEMANAVLDFVDEWVEKMIYETLVDKVKPADQRLILALQNIRELYQDGDAICIFRALSMETGMLLFGEKIASSMEKWISAFTQLGIDLGMHSTAATESGQKTLIDVQGSLIVAKAMNDTSFFTKTLKTIERHYLTLEESERQLG